MVRARDGQPRLRPVPRRTPTGSSPPEGREPLQHRNQHVLDLTSPEVLDVPPRPGPRSSPTRGRLRQVGPQPRPARGGQRGPRRRPGGPRAERGLLPAARRSPAATPGGRVGVLRGRGGRIDLGVLERVQRVWTSDMTDALARQQIQRWTGQLVAPEYLGAHVSAPTSHQTGRTLSLDFRAATALFLAFGIEWDLTEATEADLKELAAWCAGTSSSAPCCTAGRVRIPSRRPGRARPRRARPDRTARPAVPCPARRAARTTEGAPSGSPGPSRTRCMTSAGSVPSPTGKSPPR